VNVIAKKTRISLKLLENLTYVCLDTDALEIMHSELQSLYEKIKSKIPQTDGIIFRPVIAQQAKSVSKKYKQRLINQKYSLLPPIKKQGKKRLQSSIRNRVGRKADRLRKVIL